MSLIMSLILVALNLVSSILAVQFVTTVRVGDVAPEPPVMLMGKCLSSEVTLSFHPPSRYTALQRQNGRRRFNGDET
jgi:hypothetical protein